MDCLLHDSAYRTELARRGGEAVATRYTPDPMSERYMRLVW